MSVSQRALRRDGTRGNLKIKEFGHARHHHRPNLLVARAVLVGFFFVNDTRVLFV